MALKDRPDWRAAARGDSLQMGETEHWALERFEISKERHGLQMALSMMGGGGRGSTPFGTYTRLVRKPGTIVMSDTRDEINDLSELFWAFPDGPAGRIVVNGLGMGCVIRGLLLYPAVTHVDVVEYDAEVIELVGSQITDPRVTIHHGDAFTYQWPKGTTWDMAWHDVWDTLSTDNLSDEQSAWPGTYAKLNRRYARRARWQGAWGQGWLKWRARQERGWGW